MDRGRGERFPNADAGGFPGFSREALRFLRENRERNSRAWFDEHRQSYEELLLDPFQLLVSELSPAMRRVDRRFETRPAVDRALSRIRRDTRFSPDKSLYRDRMWLAFRRPRKDWTGHPSYYFEIRPDGYRYGLGYYEAERSTMDRFRARIDEAPAAFRRAIAPLRRDGRFELAGEMYKRSCRAGTGRRSRTGTRGRVSTSRATVVSTRCSCRRRWRTS